MLEMVKLAREDSDALSRLIGKQETYFLVCNYDRHGIVFEETLLGNSRKNCAQCIAGKKHGGRLLAVYCASEGRFDDVSELIAHEALKILMREGNCFELDRDALNEIPEFILSQFHEAEAFIEEATRQS